MDVMSATNDLLPLLPEVQDALSDEFDGVECSMNGGVVLTQHPFQMPFTHLGRQVTFVPDTSCLEEFDGAKLHRIQLGSKSAVFTDGEPGCCLELVLGAGKDWKTPLTKLFTRVYPNKWAFFIAELEQGQASYHILSSSHGLISSHKREDTPDSTEQSSMVSSPTASVSDASNFSLWIVPVTKIFAIPAPKKVKVVRKIIKKRTPSGDMTEVTEVTTNGTGEKKLVRVVKKKAPEKEKEISPINDIPKAEFAKVSSSESMKTIINGTLSKSSSEISAGPSSNDITNNNNILPRADSSSCSDSSASELRKKLTEKIIEQKFVVNGEQRNVTTNGTNLNGSRLGMRTSSRSSMTPDRRLDPIFEDVPKNTITTVRTPEITRDSATPPKRAQQCRITHPSIPSIPVVALQLVLQNCFSYEHLGRLREVHPHWDEICGQLLNSGYYKLLERSDKLLMALQRKVVVESALHYATSVLTNIQVHILNPVDIMRAVLDEGVCCFPYGIILDKTFILLDRVEAMLNGCYEETVNWEPIAIYSKRAAMHYRNSLERIMEERMGENLRLKAAQRIIRLESFVVDAQVAKLEKESSKQKDDIRWEMDQLHQKNSALKRENREMKAAQMRLEARVESLENKFKTLARLLS
ncbi:unnamed protein product [Caenorhabditis angaria]|uniref:Uncharacterized protein n=1 Tax=Caenorhabditis angaria TaxID=860376 RepID=A0A9P1MWI3_9PELO|nr:unnamed protein product [Caenorhabditis angaria]